MLPYPTATTRNEKNQMIEEIRKRLLFKYRDEILAIGAYGSIGQGMDGPYSDIELHAVMKDGVSIESHEFIYDKFKIEISMIQKSEIIKQAKEVDDSWAIKAGVFTNILAVYDPEHLFEEVRNLPLQISDKAVKDTMREFMIWEPYETMAKIRNNFKINNLSYIPMGAKDLVWQTLKLIGLANKQSYSTRARAYEESLVMESKPTGYENLVIKVMEGKLDDSKLIYELCEKLWVGLNEWYSDLEIEYISKQLPV
ncbi:KNTase domain-containing protein [Bacillus sp. FJAT-49732]|uniref:KNTase domain-containing protein n=2 Tax=Lederbergia citrisecunda TaxID=2833583 RepID=A0A942YM09_9BACI|nr:KNTase domain-containing protein [Lederbergia citrisecunda]